MGVGTAVGASVAVPVGGLVAAAVAVGKEPDGLVQATKRKENNSSGKKCLVFILIKLFLCIKFG